MKNTRGLTLLALLVSQALVLSIVESWIPIPVAIPGVKLGLANIVTIVVIMSFGLRAALSVVLVRCILASAFGGGPMMFLFSISGGLLSAIVMFILFKYTHRFFSTLGISVIGSIVHNIGQVVVACIIMKDILLVTYLPVLLVSGVVMGLFVGFCSTYLDEGLRKTGIWPGRRVD